MKNIHGEEISASFGKKHSSQKSYQKTTIIIFVTLLSIIAICVII